MSNTNWIRKIIVILVITLITGVSTLEAKTKLKENRLQLGFGILTSTNDLLGMIENFKMMAVASSGKTYESSYMSEAEMQAFCELDPNWQRAIIVANLLGNIEYGLQLRLLYKILIAETDLMLLPYDGSSGKLDFTWNINAGIRAPFFIMPYLTGGVNFTFSIYPEAVADAENWKSSWGSMGRFVWRPGINFKTGLDFKFKHFSIGAYYQYMIEDFSEFSNLVQVYEQNGAQYIGAAIFGAQSRFGVSLCWYIL